MKKEFNLHIPTSVYFGENKSKDLGNFTKGKNVLIICDPYFFKAGVANSIGKNTDADNVYYYSDIIPNPTLECLTKASEYAKSNKVNVVVGLGGGSALDVSKAVASLINEDFTIYEFLDQSLHFGKRDTELILIPTTAGTGSEVTNVGVFNHELTGKKSPIVEENFWADIAIVDSTLTYTTPAHITASTGMDAFCHAIEAYWNKNSNPICDAISMNALEMIINNIEMAYKSPEDKNSRSNMMLASLMAGISFSQTRTTGIHALSFPITTDFNVDHGTSCAINLPAFIRLFIKNRNRKMEKLSNYLGFSNVENFANKIEEIMTSIKLPTKLSQIGITTDDIDSIAKRGLEAQIIHLTPVDMDYDTVKKLLLENL